MAQWDLIPGLVTPYACLGQPKNYKIIIIMIKKKDREHDLILNGTNSIEETHRRWGGCSFIHLFLQIVYLTLENIKIFFFFFLFFYLEGCTHSICNFPG